MLLWTAWTPSFTPARRPPAAWASAAALPLPVALTHSSLASSPWIRRPMATQIDGVHWHTNGRTVDPPNAGIRWSF